MQSRSLSSVPLALAIALVLTACGGGGGDDGLTPTSTQAPIAHPQTKAAGSRFLAQASFGGTESEIGVMSAMGYERWLQMQFGTPASSHLAYFDAQLAKPDSDGRPRIDWVYNSFWEKALSAPDQLRQRVAYALSQIFVISAADSTVDDYPRGIAAYMDMLGRHAFGNFRDLLEDVARHPMMGLYLSHLRNQKEDPETGRVPDENFAREIMQLFSIGLYELDPDGSVRRDGNGKPLETYTNDDITGLAKVFTGFSWAGPDQSDARFRGSTKSPNRDVEPMQGYPKYHSGSEKRFLGVTIPAQSSADPDESLRIAIDTLFAHPNVGPFIGRQLIQRLVASNPSPAYVGRVSAAFNDNGLGVRGDMRAVIRAVLFDQEARDDNSASASAGKLREPVLRVAQWLRAFRPSRRRASITSGSPTMPVRASARHPCAHRRCSSTYRPGYIAPNTPSGDAGLVAPEMQITHETSVAGYLNTMRVAVDRGFGRDNPRDLQPDYTVSSP
ncbi:MAG: DUF1800 domain-containing protein [Burkholderiaceae bacterium]